jgi:type II secretory pathway predicted ATPase ExeA
MGKTCLNPPLSPFAKGGKTEEVFANGGNNGKTILLRRLMLDCGITVPEMAAAVGCSYRGMNYLLSGSGISKGAKSTKITKEAVLKYLENIHGERRTPERPFKELDTGVRRYDGVDFLPPLEKGEAEGRGIFNPNLVMSPTDWLKKHSVKPQALFGPDPNPIKRITTAHLSNHRSRTKAGIACAQGTAGFAAVNINEPPRIKEEHRMSMLYKQTLDKFKLPPFRQPFAEACGDPKDVYLTPDHVLIKEMIIQTAKQSHFLGVWGDCGSGKTTILRLALRELINDGVEVVYLDTINAAKATPRDLAIKIIESISKEKPQRGLEKVSEQLFKTLFNRAMHGKKQVIVIEEAHLLSIQTLKSLKKIHEYQDIKTGHGRYIGIILIGQSEFEELLDEQAHPEIREVSRRVLKIGISGLGEHVRPYIEHRLRRFGVNPSDVFDEAAYDALMLRLRANARVAEREQDCPLQVNELAAASMNAAVMNGFDKVTADVMELI